MIERTGLHNDIAEVLISEEELKEKVRELGKLLNKEYKGKDPIFVCVLKGSVHFFSDLVREFDDYCEIDFLSCSTYGDGTVSNGVVTGVAAGTTTITVTTADGNKTAK